MDGEVRPDGHMATVNGGIVGFFSLEMSAEQLATRIISEQTAIPSNKIRRGDIDEAISRKSETFRSTCRTCLFMSTKPAVSGGPAGGAGPSAETPARA